MISLASTSRARVVWVGRHVIVPSVSRREYRTDGKEDQRDVYKEYKTAAQREVRRNIDTAHPMRPPHQAFAPISPDVVGQVVNEGDNTLSEAKPITQILKEINPKVQWPVIVSKSPLVIIRIKNIKEVINAEIEKSKKGGPSGSGGGGGSRKNLGEKEIQVPWTTADGDLKRKLDQCVEVLKNGARLTAVFAPKAGAKNRDLSTERMGKMVHTFDEELNKFGNKWREDDMRAKTWILYFDALPSLRQQAQAKFEQNMEASRKEKEAKKVLLEERKKRQTESQMNVFKGGQKAVKPKVPVQTFY